MKKNRCIIFLLLLMLCLTSCARIFTKERESTKRSEIEEIPEKKPNISKEYVNEEIYELSLYREYVFLKSKGQAFIISEFESEETKSLETKGNEEKSEFYTFVVTEREDDKRVRWHTFLVRTDFKEILWEDIDSEETLTLDEWRASQAYSKEIKKIKDFYN